MIIQSCQVSQICTLLLFRIFSFPFVGPSNLIVNFEFLSGFAVTTNLSQNIKCVKEFLMNLRGPKSDRVCRVFQFRHGHTQVMPTATDLASTAKHKKQDNETCTQLTQYNPQMCRGTEISNRKGNFSMDSVTPVPPSDKS